MSLLEAALSYETLGWSVIPLKPKDKIPLIKWLIYQKKRATPGEINKWWEKWPKANIGIVTGSISGNLVVVDIDSPEGLDALKAEIGEIPATIAQKTGTKGGMHLLFQSSNGDRFTNMARTITGIDIRAQGGYICVAPSIHPNGTTYEWVINPIEMGLDDLLPLSDDLKKILRSDSDKKTKSKNKDGWLEEALLGVKKGQRNSTAAQIAGWYIDRGEPIPVVEITLKRWNEYNEPPMSFKELRKVILSISEREGRTGMGGALGDGTEIEGIQILKYPDGSVLYNVKIKEIEGYAQMDGKTLGTFSLFKWKFLDLKGKIPAEVKKKQWEPKVNGALSEAETIFISEDETVIGTISGAINSIITNNSAAFDLDSIDRQICISELNDEKIIALKVSTIGNLIRFEGEKISRKMIGESIRKLGFEKNMLKKNNRQNTRCWCQPLEFWQNKYGLEK